MFQSSAVVAGNLCLVRVGSKTVNEFTLPSAGDAVAVFWLLKCIYSWQSGAQPDHRLWQLDGCYRCNAGKLYLRNPVVDLRFDLGSHVKPAKKLLLLQKDYSWIVRQRGWMQKGKWGSARGQWES